MTATQPVIQVEALGKVYNQGGQAIEVLKGISLSVDPGEFIALLGTSGSGKSTLMHILGLLDRPTSGRYQLAGQDVAQLADERLSDLRNRMVGFIFQSFYLIPYASARDNVMLPGLYSQTPGKILKHRAEELLTLVGLNDRMDFRPSQLSGGQQQRVAIARALINDPQVLLADEPTGQLDSKTSTEILDLLTDINRQGRTVILVTHDQATAAYAKRRIFLDDGRIRDR